MTLDEGDKVDNLQKAIGGDYRHNWIIDNLPAASLTETDVSEFSCYSSVCCDLLLWVCAPASSTMMLSR